MADIKKNLIYSTILTMSTYMVPLIVFPYISRVLGVENIGMIDTVDNIIDYCILFSMMGLSAVGIREIAKNKDNREKLGQTFTDLFALNFYTTLFIALIFITIVCLSPQLQSYELLIPIGILKLFATLFWIEWFYTGLEEFRYITIRSIILRSLFIISVFLFVHTRADATVYYGLFVGITIGNAICNWYHKRTYLHWDLRKANIRHFLVPFFMLGIFAMLSAVYTKLSLPLLSFVAGNEEAGNYATATRVYQLIIALLTTLTGVMIPRMSILVKEGKTDLIRDYTLKSFKFLFLFTLPLICYVEIFSPDIIHIFAGKGFDGAIMLMRIIMVQLIIIGSAKIVVQQLLVPMRKDWTIVKAGLAGVLVWSLLSVILVPQCHGIGTSIVWIFTELTVLLIALVEVKRTFAITFPLTLFLKACVMSLPYLVIGYLVFYFIPHPLLRITISSVLYLGYAALLDAYFFKTGIISSLSRFINVRRT